MHNKETSGLIGAHWRQKVNKGDPAFSVSVNYVADDGEVNDGNSNTGGFMTDNSEGNILAQLGYGNNEVGPGLRVSLRSVPGEALQRNRLHGGQQLLAGL